MMATLNDVAATKILLPGEIARLEGAGARKVVVEEIDGKFTGLACFMRRDAPDQFIAFRAKKPIEELSDGQREQLIDHAVRRTAEYHETLPLTDEEQKADDMQRGVIVPSWIPETT